MRLGYAGTPDFAARILAGLIDHEMTPVLVLTQPDRPKGRNRRLQASPVKQLAAKHNIEARQPRTLRGVQLDSELLDVLVVAAYGLLLPEHILNAPRFGCVNVHASLLPRWRGAAPVERAIMAGDSVTGVSIMRMDAGLDTGPVYRQDRIDISADCTGAELEVQLAQLGTHALIQVLPHLAELIPTEQVGSATYARKLTAEDSLLDWSQPAQRLHNQIRALAGRQPATIRQGDLRIQILGARFCEADSGYPSAPPGSIVPAGKNAIVVACGEAFLQLTRVRLNRGKGQPLDAAAARNGFPVVFAPGTRFHDNAPE